MEKEVTKLGYHQATFVKYREKMAKKKWEEEHKDEDIRNT